MYRVQYIYIHTYLKKLYTKLLRNPFHSHTFYLSYRTATGKSTGFLWLVALCDSLQTLNCTTHTFP